MLCNRLRNRSFPNKLQENVRNSYLSRKQGIMFAHRNRSLGATRPQPLG